MTSGGGGIPKKSARGPFVCSNPVKLRGPEAEREFLQGVLGALGGDVVKEVAEQAVRLVRQALAGRTDGRSQLEKDIRQIEKQIERGNKVLLSEADDDAFDLLREEVARLGRQRRELREQYARSEAPASVSERVIRRQARAKVKDILKRLQSDDLQATKQQLGEIVEQATVYPDRRVHVVGDMATALTESLPEPVLPTVGEADGTRTRNPQIDSLVL